MLRDGIIIDVKRNNVTSQLQVPEMALFSVCCGQITSQGEVLAFGVLNNQNISQAVRFDELTMRFECLFSTINQESDFNRKMEEI